MHYWAQKLIHSGISGIELFSPYYFYIPSFDCKFSTDRFRLNGYKPTENSATKKNKKK
jgi:hypothetical protein